MTKAQKTPEGYVWVRRDRIQALPSLRLKVGGLLDARKKAADEE